MYNHLKKSFPLSDLREEDTALYTCTASSESGETSWSASLSVEKPTNPNIIFHRTPDPSTFPQPPSKPRIVDRRATSITISWRLVGWKGRLREERKKELPSNFAQKLISTTLGCYLMTALDHPLSLLFF